MNAEYMRLLSEISNKCIYNTGSPQEEIMYNHLTVIKKILTQVYTGASNCVFTYGVSKEVMDILREDGFVVEDLPDKITVSWHKLSYEAKWGGDGAITAREAAHISIGVSSKRAIGTELADGSGDEYHFYKTMGLVRAACYDGETTVQLHDPIPRSIEKSLKEAGYTFTSNVDGTVTISW